MTQLPAPDDFLLRWLGDTVSFELDLGRPRAGRAALRSNLGGASVRRREIVAETERGEMPLARAWNDLPMEEVAPGRFRVTVTLNEVGVFSAKACFFPEGSAIPEWPQGRNTHVKVMSDMTRRANAIYTVFPRQFGSFREVVRRLPTIMDRMGFRIIQTLPPFPVPTTYAVMGQYGCPFAATDFLSVDPAMAEFDERATPLDQFRELVDAVHARDGLLFVDLPANHTGWASTLQTHHPDWFRRGADGRFVSPGAWGVTWADLVELDYANAGLRAYMAEVFLFWCRNGVDGFRCDAGYMIPAETWTYLVARIREEYPDTVFMLEGLGGELSVTDRLLSESGLDWAYSEIFQTYDRGQFEWYLPAAIARAEKFGTLVHFAETHDNDRLAKRGELYARLRVQLAALLSWQGAWGIANGVEWFATEKIDVHGKNDLNWGAEHNMVDLVSRLNALLREDPCFSGAAHLAVVTRGVGNTLAVTRSVSGRRLLVLANLDCDSAVEIDWDRRAFAAEEAFDLVSERRIDTGGLVRLGPGEVLCLATAPVAAAAPAVCAPAVCAESRALFHWVFPRDANRVICVPAGERVQVIAPGLFRMRLVDPETGRTIRVRRSADGSAVFEAPRYHGDGTRCRTLRLDIAVAEDGRMRRASAAFLVPPPPERARARLCLDGADVCRNHEGRAVLSNGAGACAQVRVGWGEIASQYDAFLAANPHPTCPSDRLDLWARTRCWLQREGYVREFDRRTTTCFRADPSGRFVRWSFRMPCGMGRETAFDFTLWLVPGENCARLTVVRRPAGANELGESVRLVFRPDVEWRSFHATTKAYVDAEGVFASRTAPRADGFDFAPFGETFSLRVTGGDYHHEPQWTYNVAHPEEAARGQDGAGDLFSPGWISADLSLGETVEIVGRLGGGSGLDVAPPCVPETETLPLVVALEKALDLYVVRRDDLKTVIAGYPWFLDWGRDTFIFLRGMIAAGRLDEALQILKAFAAFEEKGTLPNIIYGKTAGNRDTSDAPLWFIRCVEEVLIRGGAGCDDSRKLKAACASIVDNYIAGTPNGIRMDADSALVWSPSHFTWMDTNYPACTPRIGYPVEIQALWISALRFLGRTELAARAKASVERLFRWKHGYRDCLAAPNGEPAAKAVPEDTVRPNQLFLATLGVIEDRAVLEATEELLVPGGIRSLQAGHPLYRGVYAGDEDTSRKPAYHNGTVWVWQFPLYAEALVKTGAASRETALALLAAAVENLNVGCLCQMSENADGDAPHAQKGCTAQAWSVSETLRVWMELSEGVK